MEQIQIIITDIEGTTTPISFVKEVLFPYFKNTLPSALKKFWELEEFQLLLKDLQKQSVKDIENGIEGAILIEEIEGDRNLVMSTILKNIDWQMSIDRKQSALKNLQGYLWKAGYESGELKAYCYPDVLKAFQSWQKQNIPIYIYSSGSILAQKLLFKFTEEGDLLKFISGHFDTTNAGPKTEPDSYHVIANEIGIQKVENILFLSDNVKELEAANEVGFQTRLLNRPGNPSISIEDQKRFKIINSFDELK